MLFHIVSFVFHVAASTSFLLAGVPKNTTVGVTFSLTWKLQGDDPDKFRFSLRNVSHGLDEVERIPFSLPVAGTREGTVMVNFPFPGSYLIETINNSTNEVIFSSGKFSVHNANFAVDPVPTSSERASVTTTFIKSSSAVSTSSISLLHSTNEAPSSTRSVSVDLDPKTVNTVSVESPLSLNSPSITPPAASTAHSSPPPSKIIETMSTGSETSTVAATTPASTSDNSSPRGPQRTSTIIGAVIGVIGFLLLLLLGVYFYRRRHRHPILIPGPLKGIFPYSKIRPLPQPQRDSMMQRLRGDDAPVSASVDVRRSTSTNSFMLDVEEGVPGADLPSEGGESLWGTHRMSVASDTNAHVPSHSGEYSVRGSVQSFAGGPISNPSTPALPANAGKDEMDEDITELRFHIPEFAIDSASLWDQYSESEPPPAYVKDA
ncbi:hypothetical protein IW261DRAFT_1505917 [Armillaria novae-zelandiae]|uniref:Mid2 domain-containing protein n=1 Tax=Armillaria novae-zelandiae TaxID=153914 RepID=A0AA39NW31_9AGAR|nr:hypothetical protein IW261DRAFT_1505917 [Armillaria novae-zelandiae]